MAAAVLGGLVLALGGGLGTLLIDQGRRVPVMEAVELRFGVDVSESAVWGCSGCISGLPTRSQVVLELVGDTDGIRHYLHAEPGTIGILRARICGVCCRVCGWSRWNRVGRACGGRRRGCAGVVVIRCCAVTAVVRRRRRCSGRCLVCTPTSG